MGVGQRGQTEAPFRMTQDKPGAPVWAGPTQDGRNERGERWSKKRESSRGTCQADMKKAWCCRLTSYLVQRVALTGAEAGAQLFNSLKSPTSN